MCCEVSIIYRFKKPERTKTSDEETSIDTLNRCEVDALLAEEGIDDIIENGNHDDDTDRVQVPRITKSISF